MARPDQRVRVLVVDDSVVMRRVVARALERDPEIGTTTFASNGRLALAKITQDRPDVVVLDLEMPELDGFGALSEIRRVDAGLPVVLFSSMDERTATATLDALSLGATDFLLKPVAGSLATAEAYVEEHLAPLVKALAAPRSDTARRPRRPLEERPASPVQAIVVGVSTGGPDALATIVGQLPRDLPVPVLVVQHMPPMFTRLLAERLNRVGGLEVREAAAGELVTPGVVYIAPGGHHLQLMRTGEHVRVVLGGGPPENSCRPAADVLFRSAVVAYGDALLGVVLTGMGRDGLRGCGEIRTAGGHVVVQDPDTAVIGSMPASVADAGLADAVLPLDELVRHLVARVRSG